MVLAEDEILLKHRQAPLCLVIGALGYDVSTEYMGTRHRRYETVTEKWFITLGGKEANYIY